MFLGVSFKSPVLLLIIGQKAIIIGLAETAVKNEKGATLFVPSLFSVEITAIGLGKIDPIKNL